MKSNRVVWRIDRAGSLDRLAKRTESVVPLAPAEVRVAVKAIGLNFADIFACQGLYSATPKESFIPGLEFAGVVEESGDTQFVSGDRVVGLTRFGAYASSVDMKAAYLRQIPDGWSFAQAAAYPAQGLTAWYGLVRLGAVQPGHLVLVQSAAGGVGLSALSIIAALGARAIAVVGNQAKRAWLIEHRGLAAEQIVVRDRRTFGADLDRALAANGATGFDVVFDAVAGAFFRAAYDRLRPEGRMVVYGAADFMGRGARPNYLRLARQYLSRPRIDPPRHDQREPQRHGIQSDLAVGPGRAANGCMERARCIESTAAVRRPDVPLRPGARRPAPPPERPEHRQGRPGTPLTLRPS